MAVVPWRLELFYKSLPELHAQVPFLRDNHIRRVNLPNKDSSDDLIGAVQLLRREMPDLDICCHFSCKNQRQKTPGAGYQRLHHLCHVLQQHNPTQATQEQHSPTQEAAPQAVGSSQLPATAPLAAAADSSGGHRKRARLSGLAQKGQAGAQAQGADTLSTSGSQTQGAGMRSPSGSQVQSAALPGGGMSAIASSGANIPVPSLSTYAAATMAQPSATAPSHPAVGPAGLAVDVRSAALAEHVRPAGLAVEVRPAAACSVLIVSGGGKKSKAFDTLSVLSGLGGNPEGAATTLHQSKVDLPTKQINRVTRRASSRRRPAADEPAQPVEALAPAVGAAKAQQIGAPTPQPQSLLLQAADADRAQQIGAPTGQPQGLPLGAAGAAKAQHAGTPSGVQVMVAFNPFLPDPGEQQVERERLASKLATGCVSGIYLQIGSDLGRLWDGLRYVRQCVTQAGLTLAPNEDVVAQGPVGTTLAPNTSNLALASNEDIAAQGAAGNSLEPAEDPARQGAAGTTLVSKGSNDNAQTRGPSPESKVPNGRPRPAEVVLLGSVLLPSKVLLARMKFRPWNGVFLSPEYLSSVEAAEGITQQIMRVYASHGVVPLIETSVKSHKDLQHVHDLLAVYQDAVDTCR